MKSKFTPSKPKPQVLSKRIGYIPIPWLRHQVAMGQLRWIFPLAALQKHGMIVAKSGGWKSECLKLLLLRLKTRPFSFPWRSPVHRKRTVILIDPHGDLADQCARQQIFVKDRRWSERRGMEPNTLVFDPTDDPATYPCLNPFDVGTGGVDSGHIQRLAQFLTHAFAVMVGQNQRDLSLHMKALLTPMLEILLTLSAKDPRRPKTLFDLARFLDDRRNGDLIEYGMKYHPNLGQKVFFRTMFRDPRYNATKFSLRSKLMGLLNQPSFVQLLCRPRATVDISRLLRSGKTLIFNTSKSALGQEVSTMVGRTLLALVKSHAFLNSKRRAVPAYVILDEAASLLSEDMQTLLEELRKFRVHLVLAIQHLEQAGIVPGMVASILANTGLKVIGKGGASTLRKMSAETGVPIDLFR